jgi:hypothetical protein
LRLFGLSTSTSFAPLTFSALVSALSLFGCNFSSSVEQSLDGLAAESQAPESDPQIECSEFVPGPAVGLSCLQCGSPAAKDQALKLAQIMAKSCRSNIAATMLIDGTFRDDLLQLGEVVRIASDSGSTLHLYLYFSNGSWQRRIGSVPNGLAIGTDYPPEDFRRRIANDSALRRRYTDRVAWAIPLLRYAVERGAVIYIMPMLEDNFDAASARAAEALLAGAVPDDLPVVFGRSPCPGCWPGNDESIAPGSFRDVHLKSAQPVSNSGGLVSNDGTNLVFPGEAFQPDSLSLSDLESAIAAAGAQGSSFVIWHRPYQGVGSDNVFVDPAIRHYVMPSPGEEQLLNILLSSEY